MENRPLAALLTGVRPSLPLYLTRFAAEVDIAPAHVGREDRETTTQAFEELDILLKAGFFAWRHFEARRGAAIDVAWRDGGFTVHGKGTGLHRNLLVAVLRMIVSLHHTPQEARAQLVAALGEDAAALPPPMRWSDALLAIRLADIEGVGARMSDHDDLDGFVLDADIRLPDSLDLDGTGSRLIAHASDGVSLLAGRAMTAVESAFLGVYNTGGFRSLDRLDRMPEEPELFLRQGPSGAELVIDDYDDDRYALIELLNTISGGRVERLSVIEED